MFLKEKQSGSLIKIADVDELFMPTQNQVHGRLQGGENEQPNESYEKQDLIFPSGEGLPRCWTDPNYRKNMPAQPQAH